MLSTDLTWLPNHPDLRLAIQQLKQPAPWSGWIQQAIQLAGYRMDFIATRQLDKLLQERLLHASGEDNLPWVRLAVLSATTMDQLLPALRIAALRRGVLLECYVAPYGQMVQELMNPQSGVHRFKPQFVLLAPEGGSVLEDRPLDDSLEGSGEFLRQSLARWREPWRIIREQLGATVIMQTPLPLAPRLFGHFDAMLPSAPQPLLMRFNALLRESARSEGILVLDLEWQAMEHGLRHWFDPVLWHQAKQLVPPQHAPRYGELVMQLIQAALGLSRKCLILDLDNTLWGGVIGDDGLEGIALGQGSATGEAFVAFQRYAKRLLERGILLAVSSKNTHEIAFRAVAEHPEMVLRPDDFSVFRANWQDKASNIRAIAQELNLGLNAMVFFDDNPVERGLVRRELPMVAAPEVPEDPALYVRTLEDAGYFEAVAFTVEDLQRAGQYQANRQRQAVLNQATDMGSYLDSLAMTAIMRPFLPADMSRITQLLNKSNQFNLTTRRYRQEELEQLAGDPAILTLTARLLDAFGDNGLISVVIGRPSQWEGQPALLIDTWLMSCRVLGRTMEEAMLNTLALMARERGCGFLIGEYFPTAKNGMVAEFFPRMGFTPVADDGSLPPGGLRAILSLPDFTPRSVHIAIDRE